jgi:hypothetical protein
MHIRGKATIYENVFDENDPARFQLHRCCLTSWQTVQAVPACLRLRDLQRALSHPPAWPVLDCRQLAALALHGDYEQASELLGQMTQDGFMPGPRAYHAVIFSNVRGGNVAGALAVLQEESNAGAP